MDNSDFDRKDFKSIGGVAREADRLIFNFHLQFMMIDLDFDETIVRNSLEPSFNRNGR